MDNCFFSSARPIFKVLLATNYLLPMLTYETFEFEFAASSKMIGVQSTNGRAPMAGFDRSEQKVGQLLRLSRSCEPITQA